MENVLPFHHKKCISKLSNTHFQSINTHSIVYRGTGDFMSFGIEIFQLPKDLLTVEVCSALELSIKNVRDNGGVF